MAVATMLFGNQREPNQIADLSVDVTISALHEAAADITDHPVQDGGFIHDHIVLLPLLFSLEGIITDTPLDRDPGDYAIAAFDRLYELYNAQEPITVVTGYRVYDRMAIASLRINETRDSALPFFVGFKQTTITNTQTVPLDPIEAAAGTAPTSEPDKALEKNNVENADRDANGENVGKQQTKTPTPEQAKKSGSVFNAVLTGLGF